MGLFSPPSCSMPCQINVYSVHSVRSCCNLQEHPLNHFFLTISHPPLPPSCVLVLWSSDNHPGSAPILQLAASSFQNAGAPPHETKSKFQRRLRAVMLVCRHVNISSDVTFVRRFRSVPFMVVLSSKHDLLVVQSWPVRLTLYTNTFTHPHTSLVVQLFLLTLTERLQTVLTLYFVSQ